MRRDEVKTIEDAIKFFEEWSKKNKEWSRDLEQWEDEYDEFYFLGFSTAYKFAAQIMKQVLNEST